MWRFEPFSIHLEMTQDRYALMQPSMMFALTTRFSARVTCNAMNHYSRS